MGVCIEITTKWKGKLTTIPTADPIHTQPMQMLSGCTNRKSFRLCTQSAPRVDCAAPWKSFFPSRKGFGFCVCPVLSHSSGVSVTRSSALPGLGSRYDSRCDHC